MNGVEFVAGIVVGAGLASAVAFLILMVRRPRSRGCQHDRIEMHSYEQYANVSYMHAVCLDCGEPQKFNLGFVTDSKSALSRAGGAVLLARGYNNPGGGNTFTRQEIPDGTHADH